ncbi:hypothetical protein [Frankia sp. CiP3]|nr:hypothetical protein [Frankia sp. CiP3]
MTNEPLFESLDDEEIFPAPHNPTALVQSPFAWDDTEATEAGDDQE